MKITILMLVLSTPLFACGDSACDELAEACDSCTNPTQKMLCESHARAGNEDVCEIDLQPGGFADSCMQP